MVRWYPFGASFHGLRIQFINTVVYLVLAYYFIKIRHLPHLGVGEPRNGPVDIDFHHLDLCFVW